MRSKKNEMMEQVLSSAALEATYDLIADGVDRAGEAKAQLFLAKLSLALANLVGDLGQITRAVDTALKDL
jgi:hypothetical protein